MQIMRELFVFVLIMFSFGSYAQRTNNPYVSSTSKNAKDYIIEYIDITDKTTTVGLTFHGGGGGLWVSISPKTILTTSDEYYNYTFPIRGMSNGSKMMTLGEQYLIPGKKNIYHMELIFDKIPSGCSSINVIEDIKGGFVWNGIQITNPIKTSPHKYLTESEIKTIITNSNDGVCGIYEGMDKEGYRLACIKEGDSYFLVFLGIKDNNGRWKIGDVKAELRPSASSGLFKATWYLADKSKNEDAYIVFDGASMKTYISDQETNYLKMYPVATIENGLSASGSTWSGTGFALNDGYIATNYHVVENAKSITVQCVNGISSEKYSASVIATDKVNDLAIIQIKDSRFTNFGIIPYRVKTSTSDIGENVFVLGYPLITTMGKDIKLTTGIISSKTGFMGDVALYQISAPIQPGNSGGPLFDNQGNLIGIVNAKHKGAENVGYAIKASYLNNLIESVANTSVLPSKNTISALDLTQKVKSLEKFVFMIVCTN